MAFYCAIVADAQGRTEGIRIRGVFFNDLPTKHIPPSPFAKIFWST